MLKFHLKRAQDKRKIQADKHKTEKELQVGGLLYVRPQPYRQRSVERRTCHKLATIYFGPFPIIARIGQVT